MSTSPKLQGSLHPVDVDVIILTEMEAVLCQKFASVINLSFFWFFQQVMRNKVQTRDESPGPGGEWDNEVVPFLLVHGIDDLF